MTTMKAARGAAASALAVAILLAPVSAARGADDPVTAVDSAASPKKKSWFNRLRSKKAPTTETVTADAPPATPEPGNPATTATSAAPTAGAPAPAGAAAAPTAAAPAAGAPPPSAAPPASTAAAPAPTAAAPAKAPATPAAGAVVVSAAAAASGPATAPPTSAAAPAAIPEGRLAKLVELLKEGPIGEEPVPASYLDRIATGQANASQYNDFATFLGRRGLAPVAVDFQRVAVKMDPGVAAMWVNLGTLERAIGRAGPAQSAFRKAIELDPANGSAHYNLASILDQEGNYDEAMQEYMKALRIDPSLGDPKVNPTAVGNERLLAVKLLLYQEQAGALGLPLTTVQDKPAGSGR